MKSFTEISLHPQILRAIKEKGYETPTEIQSAAIPAILSQNDLLGIAKTGTGKTAAFGLPIVHNIQLEAEKKESSKRQIKALIVTPTRELALQITDNIRSYTRYTSLRTTTIYGGVSQRNQVQTLRKGVDLLIATPGRLLDLISQGYIKLHTVQYFVMDEADRMLDMGFIHDINRIVALLPKKRQTLLFSATMPDNIRSLSKEILYNPKKVETSSGTKPSDHVSQYLLHTNAKDKRNLLLHVLKEKEIEQALVFERTKYGADKLAKLLRKQGFKAEAIHGDKSQNQRQRVLKAFKNDNIQFLVGTDVASRGIDVKQLKYVINMNIPNESETYIHRIGRAGRAGESGESISFCGDAKEVKYVDSIERLMKRKIDVIDEHPFPQDKSNWEPAKKKKRKSKNKFRAKKQRFSHAGKNKKRKRSKSVA